MRNRATESDHWNYVTDRQHTIQMLAELYFEIGNQDALDYPERSLEAKSDWFAEAERVFGSATPQVYELINTIRELQR